MDSASRTPRSGGKEGVIDPRRLQSHGTEIPEDSIATDGVPPDGNPDSQPVLHQCEGTMEVDFRSITAVLSAMMVGYYPHDPSDVVGIKVVAAATDYRHGTDLLRYEDGVDVRAFHPADLAVFVGENDDTPDG